MSSQNAAERGWRYPHPPGVGATVGELAVAALDVPAAERAHRITTRSSSRPRQIGMDVRGEVIVVVEPDHVQVEVIDDSESAEVVL